MKTGSYSPCYDTLVSHYDDYFSVRRFFGEEGNVPQREIAKHLKMSVGKVNGAIKHLSNTASSLTQIRAYYQLMVGSLHEIWPVLFTGPAQAALTN